MGYSCPICGDPQADGIHLANHLAFTAMVRGGDHEDWLDERVPDWPELGEEELAGEITAAAEQTEYPQVFEDTTEGSHSHTSQGEDPAGHGGDHAGHGHGEDSAGHGEHRETETEPGSTGDSLPPGTTVPEPALDDDAAEIMREAQELTRKRRENADGETELAAEGDSETESADGRDGDSETE